MNSKSQ